MASQISHFNYLKPQTDAQASAQLAELKKKLDQAKETFVTHQADGFVSTASEATSTVLDGLKTADGSVTGVYRQGKDGTEDLEALTVQEQKSGSTGYLLSNQITLHRDQHNPKLLTMTETDFFGHQMKFEVNEETGDVAASRSRVDPDEGPTRLQPFNALHPKTLNDAQGVVAMRKLQEKLADAQETIVSNQHQGRVVDTQEDHSVVVRDIPTEGGKLTGVVRSGQDGTLDMEASTRQIMSSGGMGWAENTHISQHRDARNPDRLLMTETSPFGLQQGFELNEATGETIPSQKRITPDEGPTPLNPFNVLHPKTIDDAIGSMDLKAVQDQTQALARLLESGASEASGRRIQTSEGWVTGHYDAQTGYLDASIMSQGPDYDSRRLAVERKENSTIYTSMGGYGMGTRYTLDGTTGAVVPQRIRE